MPARLCPLVARGHRSTHLPRALHRAEAQGSPRGRPPGGGCGPGGWGSDRLRDHPETGLPVPVWLEEQEVTVRADREPPRGPSVHPHCRWGSKAERGWHFTTSRPVGPAAPSDPRPRLQ